MEEEERGKRGRGVDVEEKKEKREEVKKSPARPVSARGKHASRGSTYLLGWTTSM